VSEPPICAKCGKAPVEGCEGRGYVPIGDDDNTVQTCVNIYRKQLAAHLGPEFQGVPHTSKTPLIKLNPSGGPPLVDLTSKNLMIHCTWAGFKPHLKYALAVKGLNFYWRIITDERIRNVFVGSESYKARSLKDREAVSTYNNLSQFAGADWELVIIKLGYLGYQNRAAAGALKEVLLHRASLNKATWILQDSSKSREWIHSRNDDVEEYIREYYRDIQIEAAPTDYEDPEPEEEDVGIVVDDDEPPSDPEKYIVEEEPAETVPTQEEGLHMPWDDATPSRKKRRW